MKHIVIVLGMVCLPLAVQAGPAEDDFDTRCQHPGVVRCVGFDTTTEMQPDTTIGADGQGVTRAGQDTRVRASGAGSLVFRVPPPPHAGENIAGFWQTELGQVFGEHATLYVQFRLRLSPAMLDNTWTAPGGTGWKTVILFGGQASCVPTQFVMSNWYLRGFPAFYTHCGKRGVITAPGGRAWKAVVARPYTLQQGDYDTCAYGSDYARTCWRFAANEWMTFTLRLHIGTWNHPDSQIQVWGQREGESGSMQIADVRDYVVSCNTEPCDQSPQREEGFSRLLFTPYMTGLDPQSGRPGVTAQMWFDELIISTRPIAAPRRP